MDLKKICGKFLETDFLCENNRDKTPAIGLYCLGYYPSYTGIYYFLDFLLVKNKVGMSNTKLRTKANMKPSWYSVVMRGVVDILPWIERLTTVASTAEPNAPPTFCTSRVPTLACAISCLTHTSVCVSHHWNGDTPDTHTANKQDNTHNNE